MSPSPCPSPTRRARRAGALMGLSALAPVSAAWAQDAVVYHIDDAARAQAQATLSGMLAHGGLIHNIAERWPLARIVEAHESVESGLLTGNLVLAIN